MNIRSFIFLSCFLEISGVISIYAQSKVWTINDCIQYALEKNIQVQKAQVSNGISEINLTYAKSAKKNKHWLQLKANCRLTRSPSCTSYSSSKIGSTFGNQLTNNGSPTLGFTASIPIYLNRQPIVTSNVVTYTVIVNAPNPETKLMPGMTANITVLVQKVDSVTTVPGKALRFTPDATWLAEYLKNNPIVKRQGAGGTAQSGSSERQRPAGDAGQSNTGEFQAGSQSGKKPVVVWIKEGDKVHRVRVTTGAIDGANAEIKSGLKEGDEVILSMSLAGKTVTSTTSAAATTTTSPFIPTRTPGGGRGR